MSATLPADLKSLRDELGISQSAAHERVRAAGIDVGLSTYQKWEQGKRTPKGHSPEEVLEAVRTPKKQPAPDSELHLIPEVEVDAGPGREPQLEEVNGGFYVPEEYIRRVYGVRPEKLCVMRVVGDSMVDTLQPGQRVIAARWEGEKPRDGAIYGLHGPTGFMVKRLRFGREEGQDVIWIWSDNEDRGRWWVTMEEFDEKYTPLAWAIEVGKKL